MAENAQAMRTLERAKAMFESYEKTNKANLECLYALTRKSVKSIVLSQEQIEVIRDSDAMAIFVFKIPCLEVPRKKDFENIQETIEKAIKEQAKNKR